MCSSSTDKSAKVAGLVSSHSRASAKRPRSRSSSAVVPSRACVTSGKRASGAKIPPGDAAGLALFVKQQARAALAPAPTKPAAGEPVLASRNRFERRCIGCHFHRCTELLVAAPLVPAWQHRPAGVNVGVEASTKLGREVGPVKTHEARGAAGQLLAASRRSDHWTLPIANVCDLDVAVEWLLGVPRAESNRAPQGCQLEIQAVFAPRGIQIGGSDGGVLVDRSYRVARDERAVGSRQNARRNSSAYVSLRANISKRSLCSVAFGDCACAGTRK